MQSGRGVNVIRHRCKCNLTGHKLPANNKISGNIRWELSVRRLFLTTSALPINHEEQKGTDNKPRHVQHSANVEHLINAADNGIVRNGFYLILDADVRIEN